MEVTSRSAPVARTLAALVVAEFGGWFGLDQAVDAGGAADLGLGDLAHLEAGTLRRAARGWAWMPWAWARWQASCQATPAGSGAGRDRADLDQQLGQVPDPGRERGCPLGVGRVVAEQVAALLHD